MFASQINWHLNLNHYFKQARAHYCYINKSHFEESVMCASVLILIMCFLRFKFLIKKLPKKMTAYIDVRFVPDPMRCAV